MRPEERKALSEFLQRVEKTLATEVMKSYGRAPPAVFWMHVEGLNRILEVTEKLKHDST